MSRLAILALCFASFASFASCPKHAFTDPAQLKLSGDSVLIVTHASSNDDGRIATKFGVDEAVRFAKKRRIPVIYLQDDRPAEKYFMDDCSPDHWVFSRDGELGFDITPSHVYVVGGHLELCLANTINEILVRWGKQPPRNLTLTFFMDGVLSNGKYFEEKDPYYRDYIRFMSIVNYARPAGEYFPKLTLLETMGIVIGEARQYDYLTRILPHYERSLPADYRVEMKMSEAKPRVLQPGKRPPGLLARPPVLLFDFIDSADNLNYVKNEQDSRD